MAVSAQHPQDDALRSLARSGADARRRARAIHAEAKTAVENAQAIRSQRAETRASRQAVTVFEFTCRECGPFMRSAAGLAARRTVFHCPECGGPVIQDEDVLDTWFSSGLWPFSTLGWPDETDCSGVMAGAAQANDSQTATFLFPLPPPP